MPWPKTLRARFALWTVGLFLAVLSAFGVYLYGAMASGLSSALDESLRLVAAQVIAGLDMETGHLVFSENMAAEPENADLRERGFTVRLLTPEGQVLQAFGPDAGLPVAPESLGSVPLFTTLPNPAGDGNVRVYTAPFGGNGQPLAIVQVAYSLEAVQATLRRLRTTLLISVPLLVVIAGLSGYFLAVRALAPIDRITRTARRIAGSAEALSTRLNLPQTDDEVGRLAATFDAMLARLDDAFQRERQFIADASHELRTPLTAMQAILGLTRAKRRTPADYEQALADLAEETDRLRTLTENLLQLARGDSHGQALREVVDLSTLLRDVADSLSPLANAKGLNLICDVPDGLWLEGASDELIRLFVNVLDNAIKFTEQGSITLSAQRDRDPAGGLSVTIVDTGPGISAEHLPHLFERFYRVDEARALPGAGLGLAIALAIARAHGGAIDVSSAVGEGTRFTLRWPKNPAARLDPSVPLDNQSAALRSGPPRSTSPGSRRCSRRNAAR